MQLLMMLPSSTKSVAGYRQLARWSNWTGLSFCLVRGKSKNWLVYNYGLVPMPTQFAA